MAYIDKPPLVVSSAGNAKKLATNSYNKLMPKVMGPFAIVIVQPNTLTINESELHNTESINPATIVPGNEPPINSSQRVLVEDDPPTDLDANGQNIERNSTEYTVNRIVLHEGSGDGICYLVCWYGYPPEHDNLEPTEHVQQHFKHYY